MIEISVFASTYYPNGLEVALDVLEQYPDILKLRQEEILTEVTPAGLTVNDMLIAFFCADGDRFKEVFEHKNSVHNCKLHPLSLNGGAMLLSEECPANERFPWFLGLRMMIPDSCEVKSTKHVALGSHWPCAIAKRHAMTVNDVIRHTLIGRLAIKRERPDLKVYTFFYVHHPDGRERSYTINHDHRSFKDLGLTPVPA